MALLLCGANVVACGSESAGTNDTTAEIESGGYYRIYRTDGGYSR